MKMSHLEKFLVNRRTKGMANVAVVQRRLAALDIPAAGVALELGCGAGEVAAFLARERGYRVTGTDVDAAQVALARSRHGEDERLRFVVADAGDVPLPAASTDLAVAQNVFHHLANWREAVRELARVLRPGGYVLWLDLTPPGWLQAMLRPLRTWFGVYTLPEVRAAFRDAGFTEVAVRQLAPWVPIRHEVVLRKGNDLMAPGELRPREARSVRPALLPPSVFLVALLLQAALHIAWPIDRVVALPWNYPGGALLLAGLLLTVLADRHFKRARTAIHPYETPSVLVTDGVFRYTRNPMYLGLVAALLGSALVFGTVTPFLVLPLFVAVISRRFIRHEERVLATCFGELYSAYTQRVRRWL